ncbi:MAG: hypothetical protein ACJ77B_07415 [Chloroflexota bacterium]
MAFDPRMFGASAPRSRFGFVKRLVILAFGVVQLILLARIALDLHVVTLTGAPADAIVSASNAVAAPVRGIVKAFASSTGLAAGSGLDPLIVGALAAWSVVEGVVLTIGARFGL